MKKIQFIALALIMVFGGIVSTDSTINSIDTVESQISYVNDSGINSLDAGLFSNIRYSKSLSKTETKARNSSVKVSRLDGLGYGSGTYGYYDGQLVVFTAQHVVDENPIMIVHGRNGEAVLGVVIYSDVANDFAVLKVEEMSSRIPVKIKPTSAPLHEYVGWDITYTGFPAGYDLLTITGRVAGVRLDEQAIVAHSFTWMGASGSGVFNSKGEYVGPLVAVGLGRFQVVQVVEDMVWIIPASNINWDQVSESLAQFQ